jgi:hypothetical protein
MDSIINESNRLLYQAFVSIAKQYLAIGEEYRSKALEKSSKVIGNYPYEITNGYSLRGIPGIGPGTMRRIETFLRTGEIRIEPYEYTRAAAAKRARELNNNESEEQQSQRRNSHESVPAPEVFQNIQVDVLIPGKYKYSKLIILKREYSLTRETEDYYFFC